MLTLRITMTNHNAVENGSANENAPLTRSLLIVRFRLLAMLLAITACAFNVCCVWVFEGHRDCLCRQGYGSRFEFILSKLLPSIILLAPFLLLLLRSLRAKNVLSQRVLLFGLGAVIVCNSSCMLDWLGIVDMGVFAGRIVFLCQWVVAVLVWFVAGRFESRERGGHNGKQI